MTADTPLAPGNSSGGPLPFAVTGSGDLTLTADRTGTTTFTVTNLTGRPLRVRLQPKGTDPAQNGWYRMAGDTEVQMAVGATISVDVKAKVPDAIAEGSYPMFLRAVDEGDPELITDGQPVTVRVPKAAPAPRFPLVPVLIAVLVVLLAGGGALWWFVIRKPAPPAAAPKNLASPQISGTPRAGETLTADPGSWEGAATVVYSWISCDEMANKCAAIPTATNATYQLTDAETKTLVRIRITATNPTGSTIAESANIGPVGVGLTRVPYLLGETFSSATQLLAERGLIIKSSNGTKLRWWCGRVKSQDPAHNKLVNRGSVVSVDLAGSDACTIATPRVKLPSIPPAATSPVASPKS